MANFITVKTWSINIDHVRAIQLQRTADACIWLTMIVDGRERLHEEYDDWEEAVAARDKLVADIAASQNAEAK